MKKINVTLDVEEMEQLQQLVGIHQSHLRYIEKQLGLSIQERGHELIIDVDTTQEMMVIKLFDALVDYVKVHKELSVIEIQQAINRLMIKPNADTYNGQRIAKTEAGKPIYTKTPNQDLYMKTLQHHAVTFGIGPAGTGKTYLAVVDAVQALKQGNVSRILLTRPAVEAGENLGFLPGDLKEKVDPYLRPLYDALYELLGFEQTTRLIEKNIIEIAPLAYMRGRTLDDAYIILDEAQNTTDAQMRMFLTRLGKQSKMVITGDVTQIDLPKKVESGLLKAKTILSGIDGIGFVFFDAYDVVRHPIVQKIIEAYQQVDHD